MRVYRIEVRDTGTGPFHQIGMGCVEKHTKDGLGYTRSDLCPYSGPSVREDCPGFEVDQDVCGCESVRDLQTFWFKSPTIRRAMAARGCRLAIYEVPDNHVIVGSQQVAFNPRIAKRIALKPMPVKEIAA
ncbi:hypothetical protein [Phyllobacterium endophyticum]|uniref:hypothetical protein n=1 Tax=Phyllobacterium endophyticum TaxID=1149773 RepID=UPI0011CC3FC1|nr:hypothetical protein [Phyllobacterium endophyticum]TXR49877.1 hypothetical protein FVA77_07640 [Phyllobacterium endophyticum]